MLNFTTEDFCIDMREDSFALCFAAFLNGDANSFAVLHIPVIDGIPQPGKDNLCLAFNDDDNVVSGRVLSAELRRDNLILAVREEDDEDTDPPFALSILFTADSEDFAEIKEVLQDILFADGPSLKIS